VSVCSDSLAASAGVRTSSAATARGGAYHVVAATGGVLHAARGCASVACSGTGREAAASPPGSPGSTIASGVLRFSPPGFARVRPQVITMYGACSFAVEVSGEEEASDGSERNDLQFSWSWNL